MCSRLKESIPQNHLFWFWLDALESRHSERLQSSVGRSPSAIYGVGIFTALQNGTGQAAAQNENGVDGPPPGLIWGLTQVNLVQ